MVAPNAVLLLAFFKAMANASRLRLLGLLAERERSVQELSRLLGLKAPTVSHHLTALKALGLVSVRVDGVTHWHALKIETLNTFARSLFDHKAVAALAARRPSGATKMVANFLDQDGVLRTLPATRRKRRAVLKWMMNAFEADRLYKESEVNEIVQRRYWDAATVRREMIGYRMMARERGVYWKQPESAWVAG